MNQYQWKSILCGSDLSFEMFVNSIFQIFRVTDIKFPVFQTEENIYVEKFLFHIVAKSDFAQQLYYFDMDASNASVVFLGKTESDSVTPPGFEPGCLG